MKELQTIYNAKTKMFEKLEIEIPEKVIELRSKGNVIKEKKENLFNLQNEFLSSTNELLELFEELLKGKTILELIGESKKILAKRNALREEIAALKTELGELED